MTLCVGKFHPHPGTDAGLAIYRDRPVKPIGESPDDGQADPVPATPRRLAAKEGLEGLLHALCVHADAAVFDVYFHMSIRRPSAGYT